MKERLPDRSRGLRRDDACGTWSLRDGEGIAAAGAIPLRSRRRSASAGAPVNSTRGDQR